MSVESTNSSSATDDLITNARNNLEIFTRSPRQLDVSGKTVKSKRPGEQCNYFIISDEIAPSRPVVP